MFLDKKRTFFNVGSGEHYNITERNVFYFLEKLIRFRLLIAKTINSLKMLSIDMDNCKNEMNSYLFFLPFSLFFHIFKFPY